MAEEYNPGFWGGLWDGLTGQGETKQARADQRRQQAYWDQLQESIPGSDAFSFDYGSYIPSSMAAVRREAAHQADPSAMRGAQADRTAIQAQQDALRGFGEIATHGTTAIDRARMAEAQRAQEQTLRAQRGATMADMQARGMAGSGLELAQNEAAMQEAAMRRSMDDMRTQAMAQQRSFDALGAQGDLAGQIRHASWGEESDRARAVDQINEFNTRLRADNQADYLTRHSRSALDYADRQDAAALHGANTRNQAIQDRNQNVWDIHGARENVVRGRTGQLQSDPQKAAKRQGQIYRDAAGALIRTGAGAIGGGG